MAAAMSALSGVVRRIPSRHGASPVTGIDLQSMTTNPLRQDDQVEDEEVLPMEGDEESDEGPYGWKVYLCTSIWWMVVACTLGGIGYAIGVGFVYGPPGSLPDIERGNETLPDFPGGIPPRNHSGALSSPDELADAISSGEGGSNGDAMPVRVSPCLYGAVTVGDNLLSPYPQGFQLAWFFGYQAFERYLQDGVLPDDHINAMLASLGLSRESATMVLSIIDGCVLPTIIPGLYVYVPTWASWIQYLNERLRLRIPSTILGTLSDTSFVDLTGCSSAECALTTAFPGQDNCGCSEEFLQAISVFAPLNPYLRSDTTPTPTTIACFRQLARSYGTGPSLTAPVVRAALMECQDVNPHFSGNGLMHNGTSFTDPEFLLPNTLFQRLESNGVPFAQVKLQ